MISNMVDTIGRSISFTNQCSKSADNRNLRVEEKRHIRYKWDGLNPTVPTTLKKTQLNRNVLKTPSEQKPRPGV
jgi:hypothetical protein